jgi:four helix bundle protein
VFRDAHALALDIYLHTREFPRDEWYGLRSQIRRSAVSIPTNIVEGSARRSIGDYLKFLNIALGSACELRYLVELSEELGFASGPVWRQLVGRSAAVVRQLDRLIERLEQLQAAAVRRS